MKKIGRVLSELGSESAQFGCAPSKSGSTQPIPMNAGFFGALETLGTNPIAPGA